MLKIAYHEYFAAPLPVGHRFPMEKYELIPAQLKHRGIIDDSNLFSPEEVSRDLILQVHKESYLIALEQISLSKSAVRRLGLPLNPMMVSREKRILEGTRLNAVYAKEFGVSFNVAGGTHHAYSDRGEGFCIMNDIAIGSQYLINEGCSKILVVDLDVHQGNGTAEIFQNEAKVFTFSMHGEKNYPLKKECSNMDIALHDGMEDNAYMQILKENLTRLIEQEQPEFIFYQAGVDALASDKLGRLSLSMNGLFQRDQFVFESAHKYNIPIAVSMGGGYSPDIKTIVDAHCQTFEIASSIYF